MSRKKIPTLNSTNNFNRSFIENKNNHKESLLYNICMNTLVDLSEFLAGFE
jgi:hypothetical protein